MKCVALCSLKGGTGKTTLVFNLAERAVSCGWKAAVVDFDPQEGSMGLMDLRDLEVRPSWPVYTKRVSVAGANELASLREAEAYDLVFCDLPGADSMALGRLLWEMDLVLSPVGVGAADLITVANFSGIVQQMKLPVVFLPNMVPPGRGRALELVRELDELEVEVCPVMLRRRVAHLDAARDGLGVCEAFPGAAASSEIRCLWTWVCRRLGLGV